MAELIDGLAPNGRLLVVGATSDPIEVAPIQLITGVRTIQGCNTGTPGDGEGEAYARMMSGQARFRVVLTM
jgi:D-arabinose 1-dehydrogenase-like Zn-dependent alcohol dehydrogenase